MGIHEKYISVNSILLFFFSLEHQLQEKKNFHKNSKYIRQQMKIVVLSGTGSHH